MHEGQAPASEPESEFSHIIPLDKIGAARPISLSADTVERAALALRFGLLSLDQLDAELMLENNGDGITAAGRIIAKAQQPCVATSRPVYEQIEAPVTLLFKPQDAYTPDAEIELESQDCDIIFYNGKAIDLGEAVAQSMVLLLDPWPRSMNAGEVLKAAGVKTEEEAQAESGPFAALSALKGPR